MAIKGEYEFRFLQPAEWCPDLCVCGHDKRDHAVNGCFAKDCNCPKYLSDEPASEPED